MIAQPKLTPEDVGNFNYFYGYMGLLNPVKVEWVLYGESSWKRLRKAIVKAGLTEYKSGHDGYTFLVDIYFDNLTDDQDSIGLSLTLPNSASTSKPDATGFGFFWDKPSSTYTPFSYFYEGRT